MAELRGNKAVEDAAVAWVVELERDAGREARDVRYTGSDGDVESPPRVIEVKAVGKPTARGEFLWLETRQVEAARRSPDFYVYLVENVRQGDPSQFTVRVFGGERLATLLTRAKERRYYEVPLPVGIYDSTPPGLT